jgi:hypothetical protein
MKSSLYGHAVWFQPLAPREPSSEQRPLAGSRRGDAAVPNALTPRWAAAFHGVGREPSHRVAYLYRHRSTVAQLDRGRVQHAGDLAGQVGIADPVIATDEFADRVEGACLGRLAVADGPDAVVVAVTPHRSLLLDRLSGLRVRGGSATVAGCFPHPATGPQP